MFKPGSDSRRHLGRAGISSVEWAFVFPALMMLVLGIIDLARYFATAQGLRELVAEVGRDALLKDSVTGCTVPKSYASRTPVLSDPSKLQICVTRPGPVNSLTTVTVDAKYDFTPVFSMLKGRLGTIQETTALVRVGP